MMKMLNESKFELVYIESFDVCAPGIFQVKFIISFNHSLAKVYRRRELLELFVISLTIPCLQPGVMLLSMLY